MKIPIKGYEDLYEIDIFGNVYSIKNNCKLISQKHSSGYLTIGLTKNKKCKTYRIHRLVANAFIENISNKPYVNHKNGNKHDNTKENLEWSTHKENMKHAVENNLTAKGERNGSCKLTNVMLIEIFNRCMNGEEIQKISIEYGVNRNSIPKGFKRIGKSEEWKIESISRKQKASLKRWIKSKNKITRGY